MRNWELDRCIVQRAHDKLEGAEWIALEQMLNDSDRWPNQTLSDLLRKLKIELGKDSIRLHRNGTCACRRQERTTS